MTASRNTAILSENDVEGFYQYILQAAYDNNYDVGLRNTLKIFAKMYIGYLPQINPNSTEKSLLVFQLNSLIKSGLFNNGISAQVLQLIMSDLTSNRSFISKFDEDVKFNLIDRLRQLEQKAIYNDNQQRVEDEKSFLAKNFKFNHGLDVSDRSKVTSSVQNSHFFLHYNKHVDAYNLYLKGKESLDKKQYIDAIKGFTAAHESISHECLPSNADCQSRLNSFTEWTCVAKRSFATELEKLGENEHDKNNYVKALTYYKLAYANLKSINHMFIKEQDEEFVTRIQKDIASIMYCIGNNLYASAKYKEALEKYNLAVTICSATKQDQQTETCLAVFKECVEKTMRNLDEQHNDRSLIKPE